MSEIEQFYDDEETINPMDRTICPYCLKPMKAVLGKVYCSKRCKDSWWDWKTGKRLGMPFDPSNLDSFYEKR